MYKLTVLLIVAIFGLSHADTSLGSCPAVDPLPGFQMDRLLGYWYAIQKTDTDSPCLTYNLTRNEQRPGNYKITEIEQHHTLWSSALYHEHKVTGDLTVPDRKVPAKMALDLPLDIGTTTFIVFMTDYDNYVGIFTCKKLPLIHSWSAEILSRAPTIDMDFVDKVRTRLSSYNIDPFSLQIIDQSKCAPPGHQGSLIETASDIKQKATNVVKNVGNKISELASDGTTKLQDVSRSVIEKGNATLQELSKPVIDNAARLQEASESAIQKGSAAVQDLYDY
ncbi:hypothetical protein ILUMI_22650 [Ignelater luminosus]|uniref:Lipocalin/cytosolic fatty-acid binding domain-containing protein n=1 Tax=Ignelater luminosus TaxID=2038154 RepID=A0A8K0CCE2_IGNLU|nr:hypothetical protein ILUMI_22650 [Ignelater luminosus]